VPGSPHNFGITVFDTDETTRKADVQVTIRNESTNESKSLNTSSTGRVIFQLANASVFASGWTAGDRISYFVLYQGFEAKESILVRDTGGTTVTLTLVSITVAPSLKLFNVQEFLDTFNISVYDEDNKNGIKPQVIVMVGQSIEKEIEDLTNRTWDDNGGDNYTVTTEYHDAARYQDIWFTDKTPCTEITNFEVNSQAEGDAASWTDIKAEDDEDLNINLARGRIGLTSGASQLPEPGIDQVRITYKHGQSTPANVKRLAILMTGRAFGKRTLQRLNMSASEVEGLSSAIQNLAVDDKEIDKILMNIQFPPIYSF